MDPRATPFGFEERCPHFPIFARGNRFIILTAPRFSGYATIRQLRKQTALLCYRSSGHASKNEKDRMMSSILEPVLSPTFGLVALSVFVGGFLRGFVGCALLVSINPSLMKIVISTLILLMVLMLARKWRLPGSVNRGVLLGAGAVGGFIHGWAGIGGPPLVAVALSRPGPAENQRGNVLGAITTVSVTSILPLWYFGLFTSEVLVIGLILIPIYSGAAWIGARYFSGEGQRHYRRAALTILTLIGVVTLGVSVNANLSQSPRIG